MKRLTSIVALNKEGAIGCHNGLPWRLKTDLRFFRNQTIGQVVIMGRKTLDSMGRPLPNRHNIVLSHNNVLFAKTPNSEVATSISEALVIAHRRKEDEVFVVGGASTYKQFSPLVDRYLITIVDKEVPDADAFFDQSIFSIESDWEWKRLDDVRYDPDHDEAPFQTFEMLHRRPDDMAAARSTLISDYESRFLNRPGKAKRSGEESNLQSASPLFGFAKLKVG
ncbi:dihydrofolate reductase [Sphingobium sp. TomTYG75]